MSGRNIDDVVVGQKHDPAIVEGTPEKHEDEITGADGIPPSFAVASADELPDDFPTEEEMKSLRRVPDKVPWHAFPIAFVELCERFSYYGTTVVFTNFIQQDLPDGSTTGAAGPGQPGALGLGQRASTGLGTFNTFWVYVTPLFGAYIADTYLGRYRTICWALALAIFGHILLVISAIPPVIINPNGSVACFAIAIVIMGAGTGVFKSNISPLVAEQYKGTKMKVVTHKSGERIIIDPSLTTARIYMYFYLMINIGSLVGQISMVYAEKYVGFWLTFTLPTCILLLCPFVMWWGRTRYVRSPPAGSVLAKALHLLLYGMKGRWHYNPFITSKRMNDGTFWDAVKPSAIPASQRPNWMTFDDAWVDEVRRGFKACSVFLWYPLYWLTYQQINNNLTSQAAAMNTHGVPNDLLSNLNPFALIILIPICDRFIYPGLRRMGINFTPLKKIAGGFLCGASAMIWACVLQHYIYKKSPCPGNNAAAAGCAADINVWAQTGSYVLIAVSEILASITGLEYAYTKAPKNMRSLVMSIFLFMSALASAIAFAFVSLASDPLLVYNYGVFAVLATVGGIGFYIQFRNLDKEEDALNNLNEGTYNPKTQDTEKGVGLKSS